MSFVTNIWVWNSGAWVKPIAAYVARSDGTYRRMTEMYIISDGTPKLVMDQYDANVPASILAAAVKLQPHRAYWEYMIGGRMLGDINNTGTITSADANEFNKYQSGIAVTTPIQDWIEQQVIPYILANPVPTA